MVDDESGDKDGSAEVTDTDDESSDRADTAPEKEPKTDRADASSAGATKESKRDRVEAAERRVPERRGVLGVLVGVGSVAYAGALAVPGYRYLAGSAPPSDEGGDEEAGWKRVAELDRLVDGTPERVKIVGETRDAFTVNRGQTLGSVWLHRSGEQVRALSAECPHLGCAIDLTGDQTSYSCPCHTSKFSLEGKAESGPSPRGMDELPVRIVEGWVEVDFKRFRQGVPDQVEVG